MAKRLIQSFAACLTLCTFAAAGVGQTVNVCFQKGDSIFLVPRTVPSGATVVETAITELVAGPTAEEAQQGVISQIPPGTKLVALDVSDGTVSIDLSAEVLSNFTEAAMADIFNQFRITLVDIPGVSALRLSHAGSLLSTYLPPAPSVGPPALVDKEKTAIGEMAVGLSGRNITIGPSHGRFWNGSGWYWQRALVCDAGENLLEDTNSIRLCQFLYQYLSQDGATVHVPRELNESNCCHPEIGYPWWKMCAQSWLRANGLPCSVWGSYSGNCGADSAASRSSDDIRARPLFADYRGSNIYIAHHTNAGGGGTANGTETYRDTAMEHPAHEANSYNLALAVNNNVVDAIRTTYNGESAWSNRGVKDSAGGFGEIRIPDRPAILIELAFHDNCSRDGIYLQDNFFRSIAEWGIYKGVCDYFGTSPTWDKYSDELVSNTIPAVMDAGQNYNVSVTFRNRGVVWSDARSFRLGAAGDSDPFTSFNRVNLSGEVRPGDSYTFNFTMTAPAAAGTYTSDWRMVRDGYAWFGATLTKSVTVNGTGPTAPVIAQQPVNLTVPAGANATFTVTASGTAPLTYQWQKNGSNLSNGGTISGATTTTLLIAYADSSDAGSYRCVVTNEYGSVTSSAATLTVISNEFIVESVAGGQNYGNYSEAGTWSGSSAKSTAPGVTPGIGSRLAYISTSGRDAAFRYTPAVTGTYEVFATWPLSTNTPQSVHCIVARAGGTTDVYVDENNNSNPGGSTRWNSLGQYTLNGGTAYAVTLTTTGSTQGTGGTVLRTDAIKWRFAGAPAAPTITQQPADQGACLAGTVQLSVTASGNGRLYYQWQKNGANLSDGGHYSGATTATLTIGSTDSGDVANYRCVVTNTGGSTTSNQAAMTLRAATALTAHPVAQNVCPGATVMFAVTATGDGELSYQWQKDGGNLSNGGSISGATAATLSISPAADGDAGSYRCIVTGGCGDATSNAAALTVMAATTITLQPVGQDVCPGSTVFFTAAATGEGVVAYQWQKNGVDIADATSATLQLDNVRSADAADYRCVATAGCGDATSADAALTIKLYIADLDEDCDVDLDDFTMFRSCFNGPNRAVAEGCSAGADLDGDTDVDLDDFTMFRSCFNGPNREPATGCQRQ